jgi:hypothetical protein
VQALSPATAITKGGTIRNLGEPLVDPLIFKILMKPSRTSNNSISTKQDRSAQQEINPWRHPHSLERVNAEVIGSGCNGIAVCNAGWRARSQLA